MEWKKVDTFAHNPPVVLVALSILAVISFIGVGRLVASFAHYEHKVATQLFQSGRTERQAGHADTAVRDLQGALQLAPDDYQYQLNLALALMDAHRYDQALSYLLGLLDRAPQDGYVNLALARLYSHRGDFDAAVRYYHNAVYGIWGDTSGGQRRQARFELVDLLLSRNERAQAQAELIAAASSLPSEPAIHQDLAERFMRAQDYPDALREYRNVLASERKNSAALAGAGQAAFQLGQYSAARTYFQRAVDQGVHDVQITGWLKTSELVLASDPFAHNISESERRRRIASAFSQAGQRLQACAEQKREDLNPSPPEIRSAPLQQLQGDWLQLKPDFKNGSFRGDVSTADQAMDVVFRIEQQTQAECGAPEGKDLALQLIARAREGER